MAWRGEHHITGEILGSIEYDHITRAYEMMTNKQKQLSERRHTEQIGKQLREQVIYLAELDMRPIRSTLNIRNIQSRQAEVRKFLIDKKASEQYHKAHPDTERACA